MNKIKLLRQGFEGEISFKDFKSITGIISSKIEIKSLLEEYEEELVESELFYKIDRETGAIEASLTNIEKIKKFLILSHNTFHIVTECFKENKKYWENNFACRGEKKYFLAIGNTNEDIWCQTK